MATNLNKIRISRVKIFTEHPATGCHPPGILYRPSAAASTGSVLVSATVAKRVLNYFSQQSKRSTETFDLSRREMEVLTELVNGLSQKMIADKLCISVHTVKNHISNIYEKLHVHSVSEAVVTAIQKNIV